MTDQATPLRILIVDDHAVVRSGLRAVLEDEEGLEVLGEAANARESLVQAQALRPDNRGVRICEAASSNKPRPSSERPSRSIRTTQTRC